jgi:hypothetical protein
MIKLTTTGKFDKTNKFLKRASTWSKNVNLDVYAKRGVAALSSATPVDTGLTASSWYYRIDRKDGLISITFLNSNINKGVPIAIILQYGHGTRNGGWVEGRDYINPAIRPIFDELADAAWKEVTGK